MVKIVLIVVLLLLSLLVIYRAPTNLLWYLSILVTEFSGLFAILVLLVIFWPVQTKVPSFFIYTIGTASFIFFLLPYWQALRLGNQLQQTFHAKLNISNKNSFGAPFSPLQVLTGIASKKIPSQTIQYDTSLGLTLDFYPAQASGIRPCIVVIHGGSWAAGNSQQLPELNSELAKSGYHVASINYRLAPGSRFPAPLLDVKEALHFLKSKSENFTIDASQFVLLGRSAGGQIALSAAYTLDDPAIKGVISFYGPTDMVWGYENPTHPLVLDSRKIMEDYLGETLQKNRQAYIQSSATETVTRKSPPTLLLYAENDPLVSPRHGNRLTAKLDSLKIPHFAVYLPWATHGFDFTLNGPGGQISTWTVKAFLNTFVSVPD